VTVSTASAADPGAAGLTPPTEPSGAKRRLGNVLIELGYATREDVEAAAARSRATGRLLGQILVEEGRLDADSLARALAERNGLPYLDLDFFEWDRGAASLIETEKARRYGAVPVAFAGEGALLVATADPANLVAFDDIAMATGYQILRAVASRGQIQAVIAQLDRLDDAVHEVEDEPESTQVLELRDPGDSDAPVVKLVNSIIADAVERGASDIHLQPAGDDLRVRLRVDGVMRDTTTVPRRLVRGVVSRIKIMSELDIAKRRVPQDGRVGLTVDGRYVDLRVATLPVVRGEAVVMRILDVTGVTMELGELGMDGPSRARLERAAGAQSGAVLVTGPTGSGKTTTLYALLQLINTPDKTLITLEDPVEYELEGVKQVPVSPRTGLTFATGLRALVRSDPDVMMVGEVRDRETAKIAIESALTGHLVLTTIHTNDAPMAAARLMEMGIEPFLVASGIECIVAQRLVRRLCECKQPVTLSRELLEESGFSVDGAIDAFEPAGCVRCGGRGYRGRLGIYEVMNMTESIRGLILAKASGDGIKAAALAEGMTTLREDGLEKIRQGVTSAPEVLRVLGSFQG
jgi:type IV pilus assembly protein PilB